MECNENAYSDQLMTYVIWGMVLLEHVQVSAVMVVRNDVLATYSVCVCHDYVHGLMLGLYRANHLISSHLSPKPFNTPQ
jgi:hypothetical protein